MYSKEDLRIKAKNIRKTLDIELISSKIYKNLLNLKEYKEVKNIFCYYSFRDEVITRSFFEDNNKNWYIPKIDNSNLLVCEFDEKKLVRSQFGVLEPDSRNLKEIDNKKNIDMVILPSLMLDQNGYRLGYGKGYYDRFLSHLDSCPILISLIPEDLLVETLPIEEHDYKCNIIITENDVYRT